MAAVVFADAVVRIMAAPMGRTQSTDVVSAMTRSVISAGIMCSGICRDGKTYGESECQYNFIHAASSHTTGNGGQAALSSAQCRATLVNRAS